MDALKEKVYQPYLVKYMSYNNEAIYEKGKLFSNDELLATTPESVARWMTMKAFGVPVLEDVRATPRIRSSTLEMYKKAVSWYMPHREPAWNTVSSFGNPTKSRVVNDLIKFVKLKEVRRLGVLSSARRALTQHEFHIALAMLSTKTTFPLRYRLPTMMKLQYHLITRSDDLGHFRTDDLKGYSDPKYCMFALAIKVVWSKNLHEERHCPEQIILGSMDSTYCLLMALSIYLEQWITNGKGSSSVYLFSDNIEEEKTPTRTKDWYGKSLSKQVFTNDEFYTISCSERCDKLGSHSLRKYPATWASRNDCSADEIEIRGRWKRNANRIVDRYIDPKQQ